MKKVIWYFVLKVVLLVVIFSLLFSDNRGFKIVFFFYLFGFCLITSFSFFGNKRKDVLFNLDILLSIGLLLSAFGTLWLYWLDFKYYDSILHLVFPAFITLISYDFLRAITKIKEPRVRWVGFYIVIFLIFLWEGLEFSSDLIFGLQSQTSRLDTISDLVLGAIGSFIGLLYLENKGGCWNEKKRKKRKNPRTVRKSKK